MSKALTFFSPHCSTLVPKWKRLFRSRIAPVLNHVPEPLIPLLHNLRVQHLQDSAAAQIGAANREPVVVRKPPTGLFGKTCLGEAGDDDAMLAIVLKACCVLRDVVNQTENETEVSGKSQSSAQNTPAMLAEILPSTSNPANASLPIKRSPIPLRIQLKNK